MYDNEFEKSKNLLKRTSWILSLTGIWPMKITSQSDLRFTIFMMYFGSHFCLEYADLFLTVFGNLQMMVINFMETGLQTIIMLKILVVRFNKFLRYVVIELDNELKRENFNDPMEEKLFIDYNKSAEKFHNIIIRFTIIATLSWYFLPLQNFITASLLNETAVLEIPYRIYLPFDFSSLDRTIIIHIYEIPMMYTSICYASIFGVMKTLINIICAHFAILSYRIQNIHVNYKRENSDIVLKNFIDKHVRILEIVKNLDRAFQLVLFYELISTTVLIALLAFTTMMNFADAKAMALLTIGLYGFTMLLLIYANCVMGNDLVEQGEKLHAAIYHSQWYNMSKSQKKSLIICMIRAKIPVTLSAGKFYKYSIENFTNIIKSSLAYVSMLRTMI